jgi:hypothetical protein
MAKGYNKEFVADIEKFRLKSESTINDARKLLAYDLFSRVIDRTPIWFEFEKHSGNTKYNWQCTINAPSTKVLKGTDQKGDTTKQRMLKVLARVQGDDDIYFSNSVPWIFHLEDGLYPRNPSVGSWNKQKKEYEIRSSGGFSNQAPKGMVKVTLAEYPDIYRRAVRKAQGLN